MRLETTPVFTKNYSSEKKIVINRGGTRSSKTVSIVQQCVLWLLTGQLTRSAYIPKGVWSTVRKYSTTLDATVIRDFEEELNKHKVFDLIQHNKTKKTYKYGDRLVEFIGADDEQKLRGAKRNILYCNEGNELEYKTEFFQLLMRTEDKVIIDFNPDDENIWINTEIEQKRYFDKGDVDIIVSTYKDNTFLPQTLISEIEYLQQTDPEFWKIYGLGEYGKIFGLIFDNYKVVDNVPDTATLVAYGQDFGFTNDPSALVGVWKQDGELWVKELIYQRGLTNQDLANKYTELGIKLYEEIVADSAEPKSIQELTNQDFMVMPAEKGADSIKNSIDILKRYKLNITKDSTNLIKELRTYKWMLDKTGNSINKPIDYNNHAIDALRYVALNKLGHNNSGVYHIL